MPVFRKHHVRMTLTGHDHLMDHWVERYEEDGVITHAELDLEGATIYLSTPTGYASPRSVRGD